MSTGECSNRGPDGPWETSASQTSHRERRNSQINQLLDRIIEAGSPAVISAYENRIQKLEQDKAVLKEKIAACGKPVQSFEKSFRTAMDFLASPCEIWESERFEDKRAVLKLAFADRLTYVRNEGFRIAETTLPFKVLGGFRGEESCMVRPVGIEPTTT